MRDDGIGEGEQWENNTTVVAATTATATIAAATVTDVSAVNSKKPQKQYPFALDTPPNKMPKGRKFIARKFIKIEIMIKDKRGNYTQTNWKNAAIKHEIKCLNQFE